MTNSQQDAIIRKATNGKIKGFKDAQEQINAPNPNNRTITENELLEKIDNKLVEMLITDTFNTSFLSNFKTYFSEKNITVGAFLQSVGIGIGESVKDEVLVNTDLLPQIDRRNQYKNYVKTFITNFKRKYEVLINAEVYARAFTSRNAYGEYLSLYVDQAVKAFNKEMYETCLQTIGGDIKNIVSLGDYTYTSDADYADNLRNVFESIYVHLSAKSPYSNTFNLGIVKDGTSFADNDLDYNGLPSKINDLPIENMVNYQRFSSLNCILPTQLATKYATKVLGDVYHDSYNSLSGKFNGIIGAVDKVVNTTDKTLTFEFYKTVTTAGKLKETFKIIVIDKNAFVIGMNINITTETK